MTGLEHRTYEELAAGYALHSLEPAEELAFVGHLAECPVCQRDVADHEAALVHVATSAAAEPPPALLAGIRAAVADEPRGTGRTEPVEAPLAPVEQLASRRAARRGPVLVAAAAAAALVVGLGGWNASLVRDRDAQVERGDKLQLAVAALQEEGARTVPLRGEDGSRVVAVLQEDEMSLVVEGLPPNSADTVYVMWAQDPSGAVRAVGTFDVESTDVDVQRGMRLEDPDSLARLMVTREQGRTPPLSTDQPVLVSGSV